MVLGLIYLDQPYDQLDALEADPRQDKLLAAINAALTDIAAAETIGATTWTIDNEDGHLVAKITPVHYHLDWRIVWRLVSDDDAEVIYIGPAPS